MWQKRSIVHRTWTGNSFHTWYFTCFNAILPNLPTLSLSHRVHKTVLYISVSFAVLITFCIEYGNTFLTLYAFSPLYPSASLHFPCSNYLGGRKSGKPFHHLAYYKWLQITIKLHAQFCFLKQVLNELSLVYLSILSCQHSQIETLHISSPMFHSQKHFFLNPSILFIKASSSQLLVQWQVLSII